MLDIEDFLADALEFLPEVNLKPGAVISSILLLLLHNNGLIFLVTIFKTEYHHSVSFIAIIQCMIFYLYNVLHAVVILLNILMLPTFFVDLGNVVGLLFVFFSLLQFVFEFIWTFLVFIRAFIQPGLLPILNWNFANCPININLMEWGLVLAQIGQSVAGSLDSITIPGISLREANLPPVPGSILRSGGAPLLPQMRAPPLPQLTLPPGATPPSVPGNILPSLLRNILPSLPDMKPPHLPEMTWPPDATLPSLPGNILPTLPDMKPPHLPEMTWPPDMTLPPGMTLPPSVTLPSLPGNILPPGGVPSLSDMKLPTNWPSLPPLPQLTWPNLTLPLGVTLPSLPVLTWPALSDLLDISLEYIKDKCTYVKNYDQYVPLLFWVPMPLYIYLVIVINSYFKEYSLYM